LNLRIFILDERQFLTCVKYLLWGSGRTHINKWNIGDFLVLIVDKRLAGLAEVSGKPFTSDKKIWDKAVFPHRVRIKFLHVPRKEERPSIEKVKDPLMASLGKRYYWGIILQKIVTGDNAEKIVRAIKETPNDLKNTVANIDALIDRTKT
jgi:hypothetical protein